MVRATIKMQSGRDCKFKISKPVGNDCSRTASGTMTPPLRKSEEDTVIQIVRFISTLGHPHFTGRRATGTPVVSGPGSHRSNGQWVCRPWEGLSLEEQD